MKILFVAMADSVHTARWIGQVADNGWNLHLFPSVTTFKVNEMLRNITVYRPVIGKFKIDKKGLNQQGHGLLHKINKLILITIYVGQKLLLNLLKNYSVFRLKRIIDKIRPDIIHSLEFQAAGYLTLEAKKGYRGRFPTWIATNWGSDIYLFGRLSTHESKIKELLKECDYYSCECKRDAYLARAYGFDKVILPVLPNTGGFDFDQIKSLRNTVLTSDRRSIMLKGYQGWAGRALVALRALERCSDLLKGYNILIFSAAEEVAIAAELFTKSTGIQSKVIPRQTSHEEILSMHGKARISIGLSISDGISTSLLESMAMGSFPIQSFTACADEWIVDGKTGILVHPDDTDQVELAIRSALTEDDLVNHAAEINYLLVEERLDKSVIRPKILDFYYSVAQRSGLTIYPE